VSVVPLESTLHTTPLRDKLWLLYPLVAIPFGILYVATDGPLHSGLAYNLIGGSGVVAIVVGIRLFRPRPALPWWLFALGQALFVSGDGIAYNYHRFVGKDLPFPSVADIPYLGVPPVVATGLLLLIARRTNGRDRSAAIDALILAVGLGIVSWVMLMAPYGDNPNLALTPKLVSMAYPLGDLLVLLLVARMAFGGGRRSVSFALMTASVGALVVTDSIYAWRVNNSGYQPGGLLDAGWMVFYLGWGMAALHPSMATVSEATAAPTRLTFRRLALLAAAALAPPVVELVQSARGQPLEPDVVAVGAAVLFLLVVLRMAGLVRNERTLSGTVQALAEARAAQAEETSQFVSAELRQSQELYRIVVESTTDMISLVDPDGTIEYASPSHFDTLGHSPHELTGSKLADLVHRDDLAQLDEAMAAALLGMPTELVVRLRGADGEYLTIGAAVSRIVDEHGHVQGLVTSSRDVSARVRNAELEARLQQSERLEAVGRLAGGIAHDFNNLLTAITGYGDLALDALSGRTGDDDLRESIQEIRRASDRAAELTGQLLAFSRKQVLQPRVLDLNAVVAGYEPMLTRLLGDDVDVRFVLAEDTGAVLADEGQLGQVILNLAVNARDAMPDGGTLTVASRHIALDERTVPLGLRPASYVVLSVTDTGSGMEQKVIDQIFEPFFTTKPEGEGTGLGLATVIGIVQQSGGQVTVYSEPGLGATFNVYLPRSEEPLTTSIPATRPGPVQGTEQVLLVEDNEAVRKLLLQSLGSLGYTLLEASTPRAALALSEEFDGRIDLLVTDVIMPEMNGRQLADELLGTRPELRVLYTSGYTDDAMVGRGVLTEGMAFLQKPFAIDQLALKAREVLDAA
jgi:PAS domain S-box-containing protein